MKHPIVCPDCGSNRLAKMYVEYHGFEIVNPCYDDKSKTLDYTYGSDVDHIEDANATPIFVCLTCETRYDSEDVLLTMNNIKHD